MTTPVFVPPSPLQTAVLFLVFNRPDTTKQVFEAIRQAKPPRLYVAADGARANKESEAEKVQAVRDYIMQNIDWECEVKTIFRDQNLGCKYAVSGAITWFFENEEQGIILEDDCLPSQSFFWFCEELLNKYKHDERIGQISGTNNLVTYTNSCFDYIFSNFGSIWGWATWKRAWDKYDIKMTDWNKIKRESLFNGVILNKVELKKRTIEFNKTHDGHIDTWDYQWIFTRLINRYLIVIPKMNLVSNLGFGECSTHTRYTKNNLANLKKYEIDLPIKYHMNIYLPDVLFEKKLFKKKNEKKLLKIINKIQDIGLLNTFNIIYYKIFK